MKVERIPTGYCHIIIKDRKTRYTIYEGVVSYKYRATLINDNDFIIITVSKF